MGGKMSLVVYGEPVAQGRPRFKSARGGFPVVYDPTKSRDYKDYIKLAAAQQLQGQAPFKGELALSVRVYRPLIKMSKKNIALAESGDLQPITKPDLDNYVKAVKDALKGICWLDDSQVVSYKEPFGKYYSSKPRVEVDVMSKDYIDPDDIKIGGTD